MYCCEVDHCTDKLGDDSADRGLFLQSLIKRGLAMGHLDSAAVCLNELRELFGEQAKVFETLLPYCPLGADLSEELAEYRLGLVVEKANNES
ncbi:MAG: hypothetical protein COV52_09350 [Gammaproteobacteria bacterium CG11_big_fil_rev_8_21_14_0_20_46_22]|nr:MAG: hypothetical protein COW05_07090 [Gammaproteobacteria bacterium CG12_big_fil_rev_8_21_14_0_65_46_12]PIR10336.1 MAG: hypothetical protein COV52_09350 [Gammaproteobacteria bacterium CG11_big_fil_rev_8_21_14_0_20_46_22]